MTNNFNPVNYDIICLSYDEPNASKFFKYVYQILAEISVQLINLKEDVND